LLDHQTFKTPKPSFLVLRQEKGVGCSGSHSFHVHRNTTLWIIAKRTTGLYGQGQKSASCRPLDARGYFLTTNQDLTLVEF
jgi:hypothetical protein